MQGTSIKVLELYRWRIVYYLLVIFVSVSLRRLNFCPINLGTYINGLFSSVKLNRCQYFSSLIYSYTDRDRPSVLVFLVPILLASYLLPTLMKGIRRCKLKAIQLPLH